MMMMLTWTLRCQTSRVFVCVFNSLTPSNCSTSLGSTYCPREAEKCHAYEERVREVEYGSFTLLVFSTSGNYYKVPAID